MEEVEEMESLDSTNMGWWGGGDWEEEDEEEKKEREEEEKEVTMRREVRRKAATVKGRRSFFFFSMEMSEDGKVRRKRYFLRLGFMGSGEWSGRGKERWNLEERERERMRGEITLGECWCWM